MDDERSTAGSAGESDDTSRGDDLDEAVIAADDTGMLAGERLITIAEIEEGRA